MTDRIKGVYVTFDTDIRDDDIDDLIKVIYGIKRVAGVTKNVADIRDYDARQKVRRDIAEEILALYKNLMNC